ncbi:MAG: tetraacyldisaccharide 4'-kinase, partial [Paramuribaculum sp.]|nr:tetraacyldisaccharide 4'-kinase [Paramuribaculum sp.]
RQLRKFGAKVRIKRYADHHNFSHSDMDSIREKFTNMSGQEKIIVTTEKDAVRLRNNPYFPPELRARTYYMPIRVAFTDYNDRNFDETLDQQINNRDMLQS